MPAKVIVTASAAASLGPLRRVLSELPVDLDAAVLVVQHRAATAGTLFARMLRAVTRLTVLSVDRQQAIQPATVYVLPPDRHPWLADDGVLDVGMARGAHHRRLSMESVIESAVAVYGPDTIGLKLAGDCGWTADGLTLIHQAGGVVVTQDDAAHGWVSRSARADPSLRIEVVPVSEISYLLCRLVEAGATRHLLTGVS